MFPNGMFLIQSTIESIKMLISKDWIGGRFVVTLQTPHYSKVFVGVKSLYFGLV